MEDKQKLEEQKTELINDLIATTTVIEELWRYHPDNPNKLCLSFYIYIHILHLTTNEMIIPHNCRPCKFF